MNLISIDPVTFKTSNNVGGWALWACETTDKPGPYKTQGLAGVLVACAAFDSRAGVPEGADECVIETPRYYPNGNTPPQDLIGLAFDTGITASCGKVVTAVDPLSWKGNTPKDICERRARKALTEGELALAIKGMEGLRKSWHHNVWDAIALGLWRLGRMPQ